MQQLSGTKKPRKSQLQNNENAAHGFSVSGILYTVFPVLARSHARYRLKLLYKLRFADLQAHYSMAALFSLGRRRIVFQRLSGTVHFP